MSARLTYCLALLGVSAIGIASRVLSVGNLLWDKYLGDVVYAIFFYLLLGIISVRHAPELKAALTLAFVLAVELFQLTHIPLEFSRSASLLLRLASILLGTRFALLDIVAYVVGIAGVYFVDKLWTCRLTSGSDTRNRE